MLMITPGPSSSVHRRLFMLSTFYAVPVIAGFERINDPDVWYLAASRLVIAPRISALTSLLELDRRFSVAYEDDLAVVFVK